MYAFLVHYVMFSFIATQSSFFFKFNSYETVALKKLYLNLQGNFCDCIGYSIYKSKALLPVSTFSCLNLINKTILLREYYPTEQKDQFHYTFFKKGK